MFRPSLLSAQAYEVQETRTRLEPMPGAFFPRRPLLLILKLSIYLVWRAWLAWLYDEARYLCNLSGHCRSSIARLLLNPGACSHNRIIYPWYSSLIALSPHRSQIARAQGSMYCTRQIRGTSRYPSTSKSFKPRVVLLSAHS